MEQRIGNGRPSFVKQFLFAKLSFLECHKPWACSFVDINWRAEGFGAGKLDYFLMQQGWFYEGHRALSDCLAGLCSC